MKNKTLLGDHLFSDMSRPAHAYALGLVCGSGRMKGGVLEIRLRGDGQPLLSLLGAEGEGRRVLADVTKRRVRVFTPLGDQAAAYLGTRPGERVSIRFPNFSGPMLTAFLRGLCDSCGRISAPGCGLPSVRFECPAGEFRDEMVANLGAEPSFVAERAFGYLGVAALDVLGLLYDELPLAALDARSAPDETPPLCRRKHLLRYRKWCESMSAVTPKFSRSAIRFTRLVPEAVLPHKQRASDSGYDLTLISLRRQESRVYVFGTGVAAEPPLGWYLDVVPRSSIIRSGYILANSVGIIDRSYRGEIMVPLIKIDDSAPELTLPARLAQLIPRPVAHFPVEEVRDLSATERGAKGFGSSG